MEFRLPALGEGIDSATVVGVLVKPGDKVSAGQNVIAVETDKASVEVPVESAGTVGQIHVKPGDKIPIGAVLLTLQAGDSAVVERTASVEKPVAAVISASPVTVPPVVKAPAAVVEKPSQLAASGGSIIEYNLPPLGEGIDAATVIGIFVKVGEVVTAGQPVISVETDKASVEIPAETAGTVAQIYVKPGEKIPIGTRLLSMMSGAIRFSDTSAPTAPPLSVAPQTNGAVHPHSTPAAGLMVAPSESDGKSTAASPATRRLARELGINLGEVKGTARSGRVTIDDVKSFVRERMEKVKQGGSAGGSGSFIHPPLPDFSKYGPIERKPASTLRKKIAENLTIAWRTAPMVTQNDIADITDLETGRKRITDAMPKGSPKVTWTVLAVKAVVAALKEFPQFNGSFDMNSGELIVKKYYHIGIAVDTERGLVVPVIRDADRKTIRDIATEVAGLAEKSRAGKLTIDEMRGGTFTITNLGGIGGTSFTPIVNWPEVAILGLSKSSLQPVVREGQIFPRLLLPLSLTYDHRVIDGADGARFASRLVQLFSDPIRLLMES